VAKQESLVEQFNNRKGKKKFKEDFHRRSSFEERELSFWFFTLSKLFHQL
jgi:hypothetical protein